MTSAQGGPVAPSETRRPAAYYRPETTFVGTSGGRPRDEWLTIREGDCRAVLAEMEPESVHCVVTSPPYWQLRSYGMPDEIGAEREPHVYVAALVDTFRQVRRVLRADGCVWLNIGDAYAASGKGGGGSRGDRRAWVGIVDRKGFRMPPPGYKMKDLTLVAFQVADALRRDGWYLRSTIVWSKPTATEPMRLDRPAVSHEYLFLLTPGEHSAVRSSGEPWWGRTVWEMPGEGVEGHPAAMPQELVRRCLSTIPGTVLDPFAGTGTVGLVAQRLSRRAVLIDLNAEYLRQCLVRNAQTPLGLEVPA